MSVINEEERVGVAGSSPASAPCSPLHVPTLRGSDLEGQGCYEAGGALVEEVELKPSSTLLANAQAAVTIGGVTADCKCKSKQATEGDRLAALAAMKNLALGGSDKTRRDIPSKMQYV